MRRFTLFCCCVGISLLGQAQSSIKLGGMDWHCEQHEGYLVMELKAPTTGWVGVGFNDQNNIVHSDLLLFHVVDKQVAWQDMYVKGFGDPRLDTSLGGTDEVEILSYRETSAYTYIRFRRPYPSTDKFDYALRKGQPFWLILAYSSVDDFGHHSRMRQHTKIILE